MSLLRNLPLRRKLALIVAGLTAGALVAGATLAYVEVRGAALATAEARLGSILSELERLTTANQSVRGIMERRIAGSPLVRAALDGRALDTAALSSLLDSLRTDTERGLPVLIVRRDGSVAFGTGSLGTQPGEADPDLEPPLEAERGYGPLRSVGGRTLYWLTLPVPGAGDEPRGWIAHRRRLGSPESGSTMSLLLGSGIRVLLGTVADSAWVDLTGTFVSVRPSDVRLGTTYRSRTPQGAETLARAQALSQFPWIVQVDIPMAQVMARPRAFMSSAILVGSLLMLVTTFLAWQAGRRLSQPLLALAGAAEAVSTGDYGRRVDPSGDDELGRLARAFNTMAEDVQRSDEALRLQLEEARALALRLEKAKRTAEQAREEAQEASRAKSEFLAHMSHEIRTPISAVIAYIDLLKMGIPDEPTKQQRVYLHRIDGANQHLISLVNDLLDFARIESGETLIEPEVISAHEAIASAVAALEAQAAKRGVRLASHCPEGLHFIGDRQRVRQIALNLVSNALKFTPSGGSVVVRGGREDAGPPGHPPHGWVRIDVEDDGIGIEPEDVERMFQPFVQGPAAHQEERSGTGLGLAISLRLARLMSGTMTVDSEPGEGSTFTIWLPAAPAGEPPLAPEQAPPKEGPVPVLEA
jgi:signal transduction histidine kinase